MSEIVVNPFSSAPVATSPQGFVQAAVQREVAEVQAAMVVAQRFPRNPVAAVDRIIQSCARPALAERAVYEYARGGQSVTGPSIRLAEELARGWGNMLSGVTELTRANGVSECMAYAWDLETNYRDEKRFQVAHIRNTKKGSYALTDERDIYELIANMGARRKRACILSVIPADVQDAAVTQCELTLATTVKITPEKIKSMLDAFGEYGVTREHIVKKIQRALESITPAQMVALGRILTSIKDGMGSPRDYFDMEPTDQPPPASRTEAVKDRLRKSSAPPEGTPAPHVDAAAASEVPEAAGSTAGAGEAVEDALPFDEPEGESFPAPPTGPDPSTEAVPDRLTTEEADSMILFLAGKLGISTNGGPVATLVAVEEKLRELKAPYSSGQIDQLTHMEAKTLMTWAKKSGGSK